MPEDILNQEHAMDDELFADLESNEIEEEGDNLFADDEPEATPAEEDEEATQEEPFLNIRYNKEDVALTREEAIELAQKGKNYDKVYENYSALNSQLERLAMLNGMDVNQYLDSLGETQLRFEISKELGELKKLYPNSDAKLLQDIAERNVRDRIQAQENNASKEAQESEERRMAEIERQIEIFNGVYPNLEPDKLPQQVYDYMRNGNTLLESYTMYRMSAEAKEQTSNEAKAKVAKQNEENRKRSLGSISNSGAESGEDDFLKGFFVD